MRIEKLETIIVYSIFTLIVLIVTILNTAYWKQMNKAEGLIIGMSLFGLAIGIFVWLLFNVMIPIIKEYGF